MNEVNPTLFDVRGIEARLDALTDRLNQLIQLQHLALLGPDRVIEFVYDDNVIALHIPFAPHDHIQRVIFNRRSFYEERLLRRFRDMAILPEEAVVFDIGANIGNHAVYFAQIMRATHVTCFEPQNVAFKILRKNIALNSLGERTTLVQTLLGERTGRGGILRHTGRNIGATAFAVNDGGAFSVVSLDDYCSTNNTNKVDFIKVDVEGMQLAVLGGARRVLGDFKPLLWVELLAANDEFEATNSFLSAFGYKATALDANNYIFST